jgi:beta-galactosidase GanA
MNGWGGGFIAFWPSQGAVIEEPGSSGGNYKKTYRPLGSLEEYEERIKKALEAERKEILEEREELRTRLITIEQERALESKKTRQKARNEHELKILLLKETILRIETELDLLQKQEMEISRLAQILRDDEEILMLIAAGVADGSI